MPKVHKETIIKEVERLCQRGVLERQPASEWALPSFIVPKKDKTVRFLSDFWEVKKRLVRKPFPIPKISTVLQDIKGFSYATALDLNMGYYTIRDSERKKWDQINNPVTCIYLPPMHKIGLGRHLHAFPRDIR